MEIPSSRGFRRRCVRRNRSRGVSISRHRRLGGRDPWRAHGGALQQPDDRGELALAQCIGLRPMRGTTRMTTSSRPSWSLGAGSLSARPRWFRGIGSPRDVPRAAAAIRRRRGRWPPIGPLPAPGRLTGLSSHPRLRSSRVAKVYGTEGHRFGILSGAYRKDLDSRTLFGSHQRAEGHLVPESGPQFDGLTARSSEGVPSIGEKGSGVKRVWASCWGASSRMK